MSYDIFYYARCAREKSWQERQQELKELEDQMTDEQLDKVEEPKKVEEN